MEVKPGYKLTDVGVIPEEWLVKPLSEVAQVRSGIAKNSGVSAADPIRVHYLRVANVQDGFLDLSEMSQLEVSRSDLQRFAVLPGDVLMNEGGDRDKLGRGSIWRGEFDPCIHQNHVFVVRCGPTVVPDYLAIWSAGPAAKRYLLVAGKQTTNLASINKTALGKLPIVMPSPKEQRAIAEALRDVDALLGAMEKLIAKERDLKQAAMQQLLTGKTRLPGFHSEWEVKRFGSVLRFQVGFPFRSTFFNEDGHGVRLVKNRDLKSDDQIIHYSGKYEPAFLVSNGDVLVGMDGDFLPCLWAKGPALLNQRVGRIIPSAGVDLVFAFYYLLEPLKEIEAVTSSTTVKHLSHGDVEDIEKPLPDVEEQTAIGRVLSDMDAEIAALEQRRDKTHALKQGMMQELLTGRVRLI